MCQAPCDRYYNKNENRIRWRNTRSSDHLLKILFREGFMEEAKLDLFSRVKFQPGEYGRGGHSRQSDSMFKVTGSHTVGMDEV